MNYKNTVCELYLAEQRHVTECRCQREREREMGQLWDRERCGCSNVWVQLLLKLEVRGRHYRQDPMLLRIPKPHICSSSDPTLKRGTTTTKTVTTAGILGHCIANSYYFSHVRPSYSRQAQPHLDPTST